MCPICSARPGRPHLAACPFYALEPEGIRQDPPPPAAAAATDLDAVCRMCAPFDCDDPDRHLGVDPKYTPLKNRGCYCGADFDGRDCMCFESSS